MGWDVKCFIELDAAIDQIPETKMFLFAMLNSATKAIQ